MCCSVPGVTLPIPTHSTHALPYLSNSCSSLKNQLRGFFWKVLFPALTDDMRPYHFSLGSYHPRTCLFLCLDWELLEVKVRCPIHVGILHDHCIVWNCGIAQMPAEWRNKCMNYCMVGWIPGERERNIYTWMEVQWLDGQKNELTEEWMYRLGLMVVMMKFLPVIQKGFN